VVSTGDVAHDQGTTILKTMPTLRRNGAHRPVAAKLAEAREIFRHRAVRTIAPQRGHCLQDRCTLVMYTLSAVLIKAYFSHLSLNPAQAAGEPMLERSALLFTSSGDIMRCAPLRRSVGIVFKIVVPWSCIHCQLCS
jgi:hypothetical protein